MCKKEIQVRPLYFLLWLFACNFLLGLSGISSAAASALVPTPPSEEQATISLPPPPETQALLNIALKPAANYVVSGFITDSVTDWPLYARVDIDGYPGGSIWSDLVTGLYSAKAPCILLTLLR